MCKIDSYGKEWNYDENELDKYLKSHKLDLSIEYRNVKDKTMFCLLIWKRNIDDVLIDFKSIYPLSDDEILTMVRSLLRDEKINKILE